MHRHSRIGLAIVVLMFLEGCRDAEAPSEPASPSVSNKPPQGPQPLPPSPVLAFVSNRDGNDEIYLILASGLGITRLTFNVAADSQPAWSPNGQKLAFVRGTAGATQIYVMNADGKGQTNLSNSTTRDREPVWSPDGTKILFQRRLVTPWFQNWEVYTMNADGSGQVNVSKHVSPDDNARWSPSGNQILFVSARDGNREVYKANADGTGPVNLTQNALDDDWPEWSPDGKKIAFIRKFSGSGTLKLYTMNANGGAQAELNPGLEEPMRARWSPSGSALLVQDQFDSRLMVVDADGSDLHVALFAVNGLGDPTWSPDGSRIALWSWWTTQVDDWQGIRTVGPDGGKLKFVTSNVYGSSIYDRSPVWRP